MVVTGGANRSFSAGGDFNEITQLPYLPPQKTEEWIDRMIDLYQSCLGINKPVVMAVDQHCVGIGFQLAMCGDILMVSPDSQFTMPEYRGGIASTIGSYMLDKVFGRAGCWSFYCTEPLPIDQANPLGLCMILFQWHLMAAAAAEAGVVRAIL